ncbi:MAG: hypothetical protein AAYR33_03390 [Acetobacteraceae bacterium]
MDDPATASLPPENAVPIDAEGLEVFSAFLVTLLRMGHGASYQPTHLLHPDIIDAATPYYGCDAVGTA